MEFAQWWWLAVAVAAAGLLIKAGHWLGTISEHKKAVSQALVGIREDMRHIRADINRIFERLSPTSDSHSPRQLTDLGEKVSEDLQAKQWAQRTAATVHNQVAGKPEYEVQEFCFDYVRQFNPGERLDTHINACAYNYGIDRYAVLDVLAIELRDVLLEQQGYDLPNRPSP